MIKKNSAPFMVLMKVRNSLTGITQKDLVDNNLNKAKALTSLMKRGLVVRTHELNSKTNRMNYKYRLTTKGNKELVNNL